MDERSITPRRQVAAFFTPSGGKAPSQPAVWVERSISAKNPVSPTSVPSDARRMA